MIENALRRIDFSINTQLYLAVLLKKA